MNFLLQFSRKTPETTEELRKFPFTHTLEERPPFAHSVTLTEGWVLDGLQVSEHEEKLRIVVVGADEVSENAFSIPKKLWAFFWSKKQVFTFKPPLATTHLVIIDLFRKNSNEKVAEILIYFKKT